MIGKPIKIVLISCLFFMNLALGNTKVVSVVYSYPKGIWTNGLNEGISSALKSFGKIKYKINEHTYDYEKLKFLSTKAQKLAAQKLMNSVLITKPDYIILNDDEAIEAMLPLIPQGKAVILNGINQDPQKSSWGRIPELKNYCGVIERYPIHESLEMLSTMVKFKQMSVISSEGDSSKIVAQLFKVIQNDNKAKIKIRKIYLKSSWKEWKKALVEINLKDDIAWILVPYEVNDEKGNAIPLNVMSAWIKENVKIPLLGILSIHTKMGFLAAISVDPVGLGRQAAELIILMDKGKKCSDLGFSQSKYHSFEINVDEAKRLQLKIPDSLIGVAKFIDSASIGNLKNE